MARCTFLLQGMRTFHMESVTWEYAASRQGGPCKLSLPTYYSAATHGQIHLLPMKVYNKQSLTLHQAGHVVWTAVQCSAVQAAHV